MTTRNRLQHALGILAEAACIIVWGSLLAQAVVGMIPNAPPTPVPAYLETDTQVARVQP